MSLSIRQMTPGILKEAYRLVRYSQQRKKLVREARIRRQQDLLLEGNYDRKAERLIVFIVPGCDWNTGKDNISGGVMSIVSICEESAALKEVHQSEVIMCTMKGDLLLLKHEMFRNDTDVFRFEQLQRYFENLKEVVFQVPEYMTEAFIDGLGQRERAWLSGMDLVHVNIMNQNIRLMPERGVIERVGCMAGKTTITTAHQKYCTPEYRSHFGVPLHKLSVWISPEQYQFRAWSAKEELLVVSPDQHPEKDAILAMLGEVPGLKVQVIRNLTYEAYKELIARAKWSLTFGEGLDGYFIEPVFSGAVSFAVYNNQFFTPDFGALATVYDSVALLKERIVTDMAGLNEEGSFAAYQQQQFVLCARYYSREQYKKNIAAFYRNEYTYS